uniref:Uncharacterized protein n=1 Tax=Octopus bimaculoides TaxID=37653 RepID=A0A0L8I1B6_OCTBM
MLACPSAKPAVLLLGPSASRKQLVHQPIRDRPAAVDGKALKIISSFTYLDIEIEFRIGKASSAFGKLYHRPWNSRDVSLKVKFDEYKSVLLTTLFYVAQSWTLHRKHINQHIDAFHMRCLRIISDKNSVKPSDHIYNNEVLTECNISGIEAILIKIQLRLSGHLSRMSDIRILKQVLFGQFPTGRSVGRSLLCFKDKLKDNLKRCNIPFSYWENKASECRTWHQSCFSSVQNFKQSRLQHRDQLRGSMKACWQNAAPLNGNLNCLYGFVARTNQISPCCPLKKTHIN